LLAVLAACSGIAVEHEQLEDWELATRDSYAWSPLSPEPGSPLRDEALATQLRQAVDAELAAKGLRLAAPDEAALLLTPSLDVEEALRENDPYYAMYAAERIERGALWLEFHDARDGELVWWGRGELRLRRVAVGVGTNALRFVPVEHERDWRIGEVVARILDPLEFGAAPAPEAGVADPPASAR
jgi:hypothetical protein